MFDEAEVDAELQKRCHAQPGYIGTSFPTIACRFCFTNSAGVVQLGSDQVYDKLWRLLPDNSIEICFSCYRHFLLLRLRLAASMTGLVLCRLAMAECLTRRRWMLSCRSGVMPSRATLSLASPQSQASCSSSSHTLRIFCSLLDLLSSSF